MPSKRLLLASTVAAALPLLAAAQTAPPAAPAQPAAPAAPAPVKVSVTPYGFVQGTAFFDQNTFNAKDYPGQVSREQIGGAFLMSARYSRFGIRLGLDDGNWTGATFAGEIEFDFKGGQSPTTVNGTTPTAPSSSWYNGLMRLRLADVTASWRSPVGSLQLLFGQAYGLVCPLSATTITWTADPLLQQSGNAWRRDPQFRVTVAGTKQLLGLNLAVAMLSPHTNDTIGGPFTGPDYGSGNASRMPDLEGRAGINAALDPVTVVAGIGYSYGKRRIIDQSRTPVLTKPTKDVAGDLLGMDAKIGSAWVDVQGEWFTQKGRADAFNLAAGVLGPQTTAAGTAGTFDNAIESSGFWGQVILKPFAALWIPVGYGEEVVSKHSLAAAGVTAATTRTSNSQLEGGVIVNAGQYWKFGVEGMKVQTKYLDGLKRTGTQLAVSTQFAF